MKLPLENLNSDPYSLHHISTYIYGVIIVSMMRSGKKMIILK